jgi:arginyl-tRNA synthetase
LLVSTQNVRARLEEALVAAVRSLGVEGELPDLELGRAKNPAHGDYASSAGLKLARTLRKPPPAIAQEIVDHLEIPDAMATAEPAGGYVNFRLSSQWLQRLAGEIAGSTAPYGRSSLGAGERLQVEFASVNPTGPLHIGHGRGVILGDSLCRLLEFTGYDVQREYYVNDENTQARRFGASVYARLHGEEPPEGGYTADYVRELAELARRDLPGIEQEPEETAEPKLRHYAIERMVERLRSSVERLGVHYDEWFHESRLWREGLPQRAIERLREGGHLVEKEGALWFRAAVPGWEENDEDRVVIRSNGEPTYFASDLGYLLSKFEVRGFQRVVDVWGADHHGYVPRMKAAMEALGLGSERLVVILNQLVKLKEGAGGAGGKMSKRAGRFVTLDELVDMAGVDAVRFFYLLRSPDAMMEFDLDLAVSQSNENPVYYAQYAHARMANVEVFAAERELPAEPDLGLLKEEWELDLVRRLAQWPELVEQAALLLEPHRIPYYLHDLADAVHTYYQAGNRDWRFRIVLDDDPALTRARLELCRAARHVLATALGLLGVSAPERM